jgi:hypothetical protein
MKKSIKKSQPKPPVKKYTAQDSAEFVAVGKRFDANMAKLKPYTKKIYNTGGGYEGSRIINAPAGLQNQANRQLDSMGRNPYAPTYIQREKAKAGSGGGMKSTKVASKAKPMTKAKSKSMPVKKSVVKSTKK